MKNKHNVLLLLAAILVFSTAIAQPRIKDQGVIGGSKKDIFSSMSLTKDGGLITGGYSNSDVSFQKTQDNKGDYDYWVVKLDSSKNIQWDKTIGGNKNDKLQSLEQTADGGYILGGYSSSGKSGDKTQNSKGGSDYWIVKLDAAGAIQWDKTIGSNSGDYCRALQQTNDGGYIVGGYSGSGSTGDKTDTSRGGYDYWIVKLDAAGNIQWDKTIGGSGSDYLRALQQTSDGGYILGGYSYSKKGGDKTTINRGSYDYWVVKLDANGIIEWDKTMGGNNNDYLIAIQQTANGGYILGGTSYSGISGNKTEPNKGSADYWIVRTNSKGIVQWDKTIGGPDYDIFNDLRQTGDDCFILTGYSQSGIGGDKTEASRGGYDYWAVKVSSSGNLQWEKTVGGNYNDVSFSVRELKKNDYVIGGYSSSPVSGDKTGGNKGRIGRTTDYWLVELKYVKPDSVAIAQVQTSRIAVPLQNSTIAFSIYPNPAATVLHIQNIGRATFVLTDQSGKKVLSKTMNGNGDIKISNFTTGIYYLINTTTGITQRVVITK